MSQKNESMNQIRQLPDVFQELQQSRARTVELSPTPHKKKKLPKKNHTISIKISKSAQTNSCYDLSKNNVKSHSRTSFPKYNSLSSRPNFHSSKRVKTRGISIFTLCIPIFVIILVITNYNFAMNDKSKDSTQVIQQFEENQNAFDLQQIMNNNIRTTKTKGKSIEERDIAYTTTYRENSFLPKGEQVVTQPGIVGKEKVTVIRTYENDQMVQEKILNSTIIQESTEEIIDIGTSEFLAKYNVHIGNTMYAIKETKLKESTNSNSRDLTTIKKYLDVQLLELSGDWCKVSFNNLLGYVSCDSLTSSTVNPEMVEKNRIEKLVTTLDPYMALNKPSGLSAQDFKKILSGNSQDTNKIFESNAEFFYTMEQRYNINGVFLAAVGIHESQWGTSNIANDKKNLFGYGAYDSDAYNYSYNFNDYTEGIELVSRVFAKHYLNPIGTSIYGGQTADAKYYNGPTVFGVNVRYASDSNWGTKVFSIMENLYKKLS